MIVFEELIGTLEKIQRGMPYIVEETAKDDYIQKQFIRPMLLKIWRQKLITAFWNENKLNSIQ